MKFERLTNWQVLALLSVLLPACGSGDSGGDVRTGTDEKLFVISGAAQKGPYVKGARVLINRLTDRAEATYETTLEEISDNLGNFRFTNKGTGPVLIEADGIQFNEITGVLSGRRLQLRAIYNVNNNSEQRAFVNVLTHLAQGRIRTLIQNGSPVDAAIKQGEKTVIESLMTVLPGANVSDFTELSLFNTDAAKATSNAYLLALSATVTQYAIEKHESNNGSPAESELTYLLDNLASNIAETGRLDNVEVIANLKSASMRLRPDKIKANLAMWGQNAVHQLIPVADLDMFIDTDGDGTVNLDDIDDDGDGIIDAKDATPYVKSTAPALDKPQGVLKLPSLENVTLDWSTTEKVKEIETQISETADFSKPLRSVISDQNVTPIRFEVAGEYFVRARAQNMLGSWTNWSSPQSILVGTLNIQVAAGWTKRAKSVISAREGGFIIFGQTELQNPPGKNWVIKLDRQGNRLWEYISPLQSSGTSQDQMTELSDGAVAFTDTYGMYQGHGLLKVLDNNGNLRWAKDISLLGGTITNAISIGDSLYVVLIGENCYNRWYICDPLKNVPTLIEIDPDSGETKRTVSISGNHDFSLVPPSLISLSHYPFPNYVNGEHLGDVEDISPWVAVLSLEKVADNRMSLTFISRFDRECLFNAPCYRAGFGVMDKNGVFEFVWQSPYGGDSFIDSLSAMASDGVFFFYEQAFSKNGLDHAFTAQIDLNGNPTGMVLSSDVRTSNQLIVTKKGQLVSAVHKQTDAGLEPTIVVTNLETKTSRQIKVPCSKGSWCEIVSHAQTADGGVVILLQTRNVDFTFEYTLLKILDPDKLACCSLVVQ